LALRDLYRRRIGDAFHYAGSFAIAVDTANGTRVPSFQYRGTCCKAAPQPMPYEQTVPKY
jgi:hypothetical protein